MLLLYKGNTLHNVSTFDLDVRVRQCALKLQDKPLLAEVSAGVRKRQGIMLSALLLSTTKQET